MILAGIVVYNPDIERLIDNIDAIIKQVDKVILVDNGSSDIDEIIHKISNEFEVEWIKNIENKGIAYALNQILNYSYHNGFEWFITLDQDSVVQPLLINYYKKYFFQNNLAIITCLIKDRNTNSVNLMKNDYKYIDECITSGSCCNTKKIYDLLGFDDKLFIDMVDIDLCYRLNKQWKIIQVNYIGMLHEIGHSSNKKFLNRTFTVYNENKQRVYYKTRNCIYLIKKHKNIKLIYILFVDLFKILVWEKNKIQRIYAFGLGSIHGLIGKYGKYELK